MQQAGHWPIRFDRGQALSGGFSTDRRLPAERAKPSSAEVGHPQAFEPRDSRTRERALLDRGKRLLEVVERADPDHPGRKVAFAEHEAKCDLRARAVAV